MKIHEENTNDYIIRIPFSHHPYSNCVQDIFVTYLKWKEENYKKLFDNTWNFCFHENNKYLDIDIYNDSDLSQIHNSLDRQFGIKLEFIYEFKEHKILLENIRREFTKKNILGACIDTFYCDWTKEYQKKHNIHYVLITGIKSNCFIISDPYGNIKVQYLPINTFFITTKNLFFFKHDKKTKICPKENIVTIINNMLEDANGNNGFKQMRKFANILRNSTRVRDESNLYENIIYYPLLVQLNNIGFGRKCFSIYLEEVCGCYPNFNIGDIIFSLNKIAETWAHFSMKIVKYVKSGYRNSTIFKLADDIDSISIIEEELASNLKERIFF